jgi:hypothetical protein
MDGDGGRQVVGFALGGRPRRLGGMTGVVDVTSSSDPAGATALLVATGTSGWAFLGGRPRRFGGGAGISSTASPALRYRRHWM